MAGLAVIGPGLPLHPGLARPEQWTTWLTEVGPAVAVMAAIRQVGLVLGGYLLVVTSLDLVAHLTRSNVLATMAGCVTVPTVRRLIAGATGAGLAASFTVAALAPGLASASAPTRRRRRPAPTRPGRPTRRTHPGDRAATRAPT